MSWVLLTFITNQGQYKHVQSESLIIIREISQGFHIFSIWFKLIVYLEMIIEFCTPQQITLYWEVIQAEWP